MDNRQIVVFYKGMFEYHDQEILTFPLSLTPDYDKIANLLCSFSEISKQETINLRWVAFHHSHLSMLAQL